MRFVLALILATTLIGLASAEELGVSSRSGKGGLHLLRAPVSDAKSGGETVADALVIAGLPFSDSGATCDNLDDFNADCPYTGPGSPDVAYLYTPAQSGYVRIDLCGSAYDTRLLVYDAAGTLIDCNDDGYPDGACGRFTSLLPATWLSAGVAYTIVVDGFGGDCGSYVLNVSAGSPPPVCTLGCSGVPENEPTLADGTVDQRNGGCNTSLSNPALQDLIGDTSGFLVLCGRSGWYDDFLRDTDWFLGVIGRGGTMEWTLDAEQPMIAYQLQPLDCDNLRVLQTLHAGPCAPATMTISGNHGEVVWLWAGPESFVPPPGFVGHEFNYLSIFNGMESGEVGAEPLSWDAVKSLYR